MSKALVFNQIGWVETNGSWGVSDVILFSPDDLTDEQYDRLDRLNDNDKFDYVQTILNNENLSKWEN